MAAARCYPGRPAARIDLTSPWRKVTHIGPHLASAPLSRVALSLPASKRCRSMRIPRARAGGSNRSMSTYRAAGRQPPQPPRQPSAVEPRRFWSFEQPTSGLNIGTRNPFTVMGYALDKSASLQQGSQGSGIDLVSIYVDAERDNNGTFLGTADLAFSDPSAQSTYRSQFVRAGGRFTLKT